MLTARRRGGQRTFSPLALHPLLAAAYPVLFLFAQNVAEQVTLQPLWIPLALAVLGGAAALVVGRLITGDWLRGALLATLAIALFFSFGHVWNVVADAFALHARRGLILAYAAIGLAGAFVIWRGGRWVDATSGFITLALVIACLINAWSIAGFTLRTSDVQAAANAPIEVSVGEHGRPDIYFLILDRYASAKTLAEQYSYDNTPFLDGLRARGFSIATEAWANYLKTGLSLSSTLSMDFLDGPSLAASAEEGQELAAVYELLQTHLPVPATLQSLGYEYVHIGSYWEPTGTNPFADRVIGSARGDQFSSALLSTTALSLLSPPLQPGEQTDEGFGTYKEFTLRQFDHLEEAAQIRGPKFVFSHFLVPHPPYWFDSDGSSPTEAERAERSDEEEYVRQLQWTNQRVLSALDVLLDPPNGEEPVIVLAADEGPFPAAFNADQRRFDWLEATPAQIQRKYGILNAIHMPGVDPAQVGFGDRSSPVNTFRYVMNAYFSANLELLPDVTYLSPDLAHLYDFVEIDRTDQGEPILPATGGGG